VRRVYTRPDDHDGRRGVEVDWLNRWFDEQTSTPMGSVLLFLLVFLARVGIDEWSRRRATRKAKPRKVAN